jgi:predicted O-methyltransferase YrrM
MAALKYYTRNPGQAIQALRNPLTLSARLGNQLDAKVEDWLGLRRRPAYSICEDWQERLHAAAGHPGECSETGEFERVWSVISARLSAQGYRVGPESYFGWNDGDLGLTRALWCLVRHLRPMHVVETGVGHGITTRFILEALHRNGSGHLWSIDLPPVDPAVAAQVGIAVEGACAERWTLLRGTSRQLLPGLLAELGRLDLFIHDSAHTVRNMRFEINQAQRVLRAEGFIVVDDIDLNSAFSESVRELPAQRWLVCEARPVRPDYRRFNHKGLFGVILPAKPVPLARGDFGA